MFSLVCGAAIFNNYQEHMKAVRASRRAIRKQALALAYAALSRGNSEF